MTDAKDNIAAPQLSRPEAIRWSWKEIILIVVTSAGLLLAGAIPISLLLSPPDGFALDIKIPPLLLTAGLLIVETASILIGITVFGLRGNANWRDKIGFTLPSTNWLLIALGVAILFVPLLGLIAYLVQLALGQEYSNPQLPLLAPGKFYAPGAVLMLAAGGIAAPIAEEMLFRGVLYQWTRNRLPPAAAILLNGIVFGLAHGEVSLAVATGMMGMVLAWFFERSKSLWPSILIHAFNNTSKLLLLYILLALGIEIPV